MNSLGIYFGPKVISIVETKGKRLINNIQLLQSTISGGDLEEKVPEELKIVALFKDELRKNKVEAREATIALSGKDLIIRTFEIPILPRHELRSAVNFEVKKYIPFKVEELISDFQLELDKSSRKNLILFIGIKKEILDKYLSIISQLNLKINSIEYSAFSVLRLFRLTNVRKKGIIAVVNIDLIKEDEVNFVVLENSFPLFSRDITFAGELPTTGQTEEGVSSAALEKLKTEIRISLDYYHRKFPLKNIKKAFFITGQDYRSDLETLAKDIGLDMQFIDANKYIGKPVPFSLSFIKGYSSSLSKVIKTPLKINLLLVETKTMEEIGATPKAFSISAGLRVESRIVILGLLICIATFVFGHYRTLYLRRELDSIISMRPQLSTVKPDARYEELSNVNSEYKKKITAIDNLMKKQLYLTEQLNVIARLIPEGMRLTDFSFKKEEDKSELRLVGMAYLADSSKELALVNIFISGLKRDQTFNRYFKEIDIISLETIEIEQKMMTRFVISCRN